MKLHLPKQLFTALLTALSYGSIAWGAITTSTNEYYYDKASGDLYYYNSTEEVYYSATTGQAAQTQPASESLTQVTMYIGDSSSGMTNSNVTAHEGYLIGFQLGDNGTSNWFNDSTTYGDILIYDVNPDDNSKQGLVISNGNSGKTIEFAGSVYGNGFMYKRGAGMNNTWKFTGDVTNYTGNIILSHSDTNSTSFTLQFGKDDGSSTQTGSATAGVAGTGAITFGSAYNTITFNYSNTSSPVYITNTIKVEGSGLSKVELSGNAGVVFTKDVTIHCLTTSANSITFSGIANIGQSGQNTDFRGGELIVNPTGKLYLNGNALNVGKLNAGSGAIVNLNNNSTLTLGAATHTIGTLSGSGTLSISSSTSNASATISKLGGYTGTITVDKAGTGTAGLTASVQEGALNLAGITVKNGATATIRTRVNNNENLGQNISLGNVAVGGNSTLTIHFSGNEMRTATMTSLDVNGTATVVANNYQGQININSLTSSGGTNTLILRGNTPSDAGRTVFNLEDGAFDGSIKFIANASGTRKFALNIKDSSVVHDAVINVSKENNGNDHHMAIGIVAESVTVKGLTGGIVNSGIYSGDQQFGNFNNFSADTSVFRTLIIDTDGSKGLAANTPEPEYSTSSSLSSNLHLQKDGVGSQTFNGNLSAFNGSITVNQGTLALQSTAAMNNVQNITVNGGVFDFRGSGTLNGKVMVAEGASATLIQTDGAQLTLCGTIENNGTLELGGSYALVDDLLAYRQKSTDGVSFSLSDGNGFCTFNNAQFYLTYGDGTTTGDITLTHGNETYQVDIDDDNNMYFTTGTGSEGNVFYVTNGTQTIDATIAERATGYILRGGEMVVSSGLEVNASIITCHQGKLRMNGSKLVVGTDQNDLNDLSSFSEIILNNGGNISYTGKDDGDSKKMDFQKISVQSGTGIFYLSDSGGTSTSGNVIQFGEIAVATGATMQLKSEWQDSAFYVEKLTGDGTFEASGANGDGDCKILTVNNLGEFSGDLKFTKGKGLNLTVNTGSTGVTFRSLSADDLDTFTFNVNAATTIGKITAGKGTVTIAKNVMLTLENGTAVAPKIHSIKVLNGSGSLYLAENTVLNSLTAVSGVTLTGAGILEFATGNSSVNNVSYDANWTGTVKLSGITNASGLNFKSYGNETSKVELNGVSGWFERSTYNTHMVLTGGGLTMTAYSTSNSFDFNKGISGSGDFIINGTSDSDPTFKIGANADGQTWSGAFKVNQMNSAKSLNLYLAGDGSYFDADSETSGVQMNSAGTLNLYTGNTSSGTTTINGTISNNGDGSLNLTVEGDTEFNKDVTASSVTVNSGKSTMVNSTLTANNVTNKGTLKLGEAATVTGGTMSKVQLSSKGISGTAKDGAKGSVSNAVVQINQLAEDASFTITEMNFSNASISAASGMKVKLEKVKAEQTRLTGGGQFMLYAGPQEMTMAEATAEGMNRTLTYSSGLGVSGEGTTLTLNLDVLNAVAPDQRGVYDISITLNGYGAGYDFSTLGDDIKNLVQFDADSWLGQMLADVEWTMVEKPNDTETASAESTAGVTYYTDQNVGELVITIHGLNVPEPTTSTLSLLSLAALCARRRRR